MAAKGRPHTAKVAWNKVLATPIPEAVLGCYFTKKDGSATGIASFLDLPDAKTIEAAWKEKDQRSPTFGELLTLVHGDIIRPQEAGGAIDMQALRQVGHDISEYGSAKQYWAQKYGRASYTSELVAVSDLGKFLVGALQATVIAMSEKPADKKLLRQASKLLSDLAFVYRTRSEMDFEEIDPTARRRQAQESFHIAEKIADRADITLDPKPLPKKGEKRSGFPTTIDLFQVMAQRLKDEPTENDIAVAKNAAGFNERVANALDLGAKTLLEQLPPPSRPPKGGKRESGR